MHTNVEMLQELGVWNGYKNYYKSDTIRELRLMEAKEKSLEFKKRITKKRVRK